MIGVTTIPQVGKEAARPSAFPRSKNRSSNTFIDSRKITAANAAIAPTIIDNRDR